MASRLLALVLCVTMAVGAGCAHEPAYGRSWVHTVRFRGLTGVVDTVIKPYKKRGAVDLEFVVDQGPVTRVASTSVVGADPARFEVGIGEIFDHDRYLVAKQKLVLSLQNGGHAWPQVTGAVQVDPERRAATIQINAVPGPITRLAELSVGGTTSVKPRLIARHAGLRRGELYRPERLDEMRGRLYELGLFSSVAVDLDELAPGQARVHVTVRDAPLNELKFGLGFGLEQQRNDVHSRVTWLRHGIGGGLLRLRMSLEPAYVVIPAVWDIQKHDFAGAAEVELRQLDLPWVGSTISWTLGYDLGVDYAFNFHGPRTQLAFGQSLWHDRVHVGVGYNFQFLDFFKVQTTDDNPNPLNDLRTCGAVCGYKDPYRVGWFAEEVALDLRDRPLDAHRGFYSSLAAEEGGVYSLSDFDYEKLLTQVRGYIPLGEFATLAAEAQFGQIFSHGENGSPITRRFYLGGPSSHRGFSYNRLSPFLEGPDKNDPTKTVRWPVGGDQMFLVQFEIRVQVIQIVGQWLGLALFADGGDVVPRCDPTTRRVDCDFIDISQLHWAVGAGLRFKTQLGTLRFDLGTRINRYGVTERDGRENPDPGERIAFHLSFGEAF
jgi:outer membrane protein assembly factor BamA